MPDAHKNFAYGTVLTAPSPATSGTSLVLNSGQGALMPTAPFNATIWPVSTQPTTANAEVVRVTLISTDTLTITRTQESSSARTVIVGDQVAATVTTKTLTDIETDVVNKAPRQYPKFVSTIPPWIAQSSIAPGVINSGYMTRIMWPETGTIDRLMIWCLATGAGNVDIGVYDTTVTTRNRLASIGSTALVASSYVQGTVSLAVTAGVSVDLAFSVSSATSTVAATPVNAGSQATLPSGWIPVTGGGKPTMTNYVGSAFFPLPATIAESSMAGDTYFPFIAARYV